MKVMDVETLQLEVECLLTSSDVRPTVKRLDMYSKWERRH